MPRDSVRNFIDRQRRIAARCFVCGRSMDVDLERIAEAKGDGFILANHRPFCRFPGCPGRVEFIDRSSLWAKRLDDLCVEAMFEFGDIERKRLEGLGWTYHMGHWYDPNGCPPWKRGESRPPPSPHTDDEEGSSR